MAEVLRPISVDVTDTAYKSAVLVGGATALSDESDTTYAEQWLSIRDSAQDGPLAIATFAPSEAVPFDDFFRFRFEVFNDSGGTGSAFFITVNSGGLEVGSLQQGGSFAVEAPATDTIYDWTGWTFVPSGAMTMAEAFAAGFDIRTRRLDLAGTVDGDFGIRVYEITATGESLVPPVVPDLRATRLWPRDDALGIGTGRRIYPPPRSRRLVGGQH